MRCVVVIKKAVFDRGGRAQALALAGDSTARRLVAAAEEHRATVAAVEEALAQLGVRYVKVSDPRGAVDVADLVVSVGGDGTLLGAAHRLLDGAVLGVNSAPSDSIGHFCAARRDDVGEWLAAILAGRRPQRRHRMAVRLDGHDLPDLALNDVLVANACPAATSRYLVAHRGVEEEHRSSGLWVATAAGSTAAIGSAGGAAQRPRSRRLQYLVRELYREPGRDYVLERGFVKPGEALHVASKMDRGRLWIDGARIEHPFPFGARAELRVAAAPLRIHLGSL